MADNNAQEVFLGRQPILGRDQQLLAYELLFRNGQIASGNNAVFLNATQATATVITNAFSEFSVGDALGPYRGYINVDHEFLFSDLIELLPPTAVVLEILESIQPTPEVLVRCRHLCDLGFVLAIDDVVQASAAYLPLLSLAEIIKIDIQALGSSELESLVEQLKPLGKQLLAEKIETDAQLKFCQDLGFDLFQGYFFAKPTVIAGKKLHPVQLTLIRLLGLLMEDADTAVVEQTFKQEPGLTVNLLRLTNSVGGGMACKITSLRHAITLLGRRQLQRWLQLLLYTNPKGSSQAVNPLLQLAATRGRLMELLAEKRQAKNREFAEHAFMVGIMSLMPALLGISMAEILEQLPVAQRVKQALIDDGGPHGDLLRLVKATEEDEPQAVSKALQALPGSSVVQLNACLAQALNWANTLGMEH